MSVPFFLLSSFYNSIFLFLLDRFTLFVLIELLFLFFFFLLVMLLVFDSNVEAINLSFVHARNGCFSFLFCTVVYNCIIFGSSNSTRTNVSKMRKDFVDMVLCDIWAEILNKNRYYFNAIFARIRRV